MAKKRKTREQKKLADLRHSFQHHLPSTFEVKIPSNQITSMQTEVTAVSTAYPFLVQDLSRTFVLTLIIVAAQFALFFVLKNHIFAIPGLNY